MTEQSSGGGAQRFIGLSLTVSSTDFWGWGFIILVLSGLSAAAGYAVFVVGWGLSR